MSKDKANANPVNQSQGVKDKGSEPAQEQQAPRHDRQNLGNNGGTDTHAQNQGRQDGQGAQRDQKPEKGDANRTPKR